MASVVVVPYSNEWPSMFGHIRDMLVRAFKPITVVVEHIGSTSVPGLSAKPVIDVLLGANSLTDIESKISALDELGYLYVPKYETELPMRRYFVKSPPDSLRIHLHAVELGSPIWVEHLTFRDALRNDSNLRSDYQYLKLQLATRFSDDKSAYTAAKDPFIQSVLASAAPKPFCLTTQSRGPP
jgi:GrpB-like predicted nucleotidyltransferase (UPF0157 family)